MMLKSNIIRIPHLVIYLALAMLCCLYSPQVWSACSPPEGPYSYSQISPGTGCLDGTQLDVPVIANPNQDLFYSNRKIMIRLDVGDLYTLGGLPWSYELKLELEAQDVDNNLIQVFPVNLLIQDDDISGSIGIPEDVAFIDYSDDQSVHHFVITVAQSDLDMGLGAHYLANELIRLSISAEDEIARGVKHAGSDIRVENIQVQGMNSIQPPFDNVRFTWDLSTPAQYFESYDLELLKLEPQLSQAGPVPVEIDWGKASRIEVEGGKREYTMTLSEGTGYYAWRVRPIGSFFPGKREDRRNYGKWNIPGTGVAGAFLSTHHYTFVAPYEISTDIPVNQLQSSPVAMDFFHNEQLDNEFNWIYGKVLTEGSRQSETMTFANGLNQVQQVQTKLFSIGEVIGTQTVYDFSGRPALQSLPAPVNSQFLGYKPDFFDNADNNLYSAPDFDTKATLYDGASADLSSTQASPRSYYNAFIGGIMDLYIPAAGEVPYTRTLYHPDATGRVWRQAGVGTVMRLSDDYDPASNHNVTTQYGGVAQDELDRVFGNEAPLSNTVYKVETVDPNGVRSVSYVGKAGQVLATALNNDIRSLTNLEDLDYPQETSFTVVDVLDEGEVVPNAYVSETSTTLLVTGNDTTTTPPVTEVKFDYQITPATFGIDCDVTCTDCDICWECDYRVEISIDCPQFPDDPDRNVTLSFTVTPSAFVCGGTPPALLYFNTGGNNIGSFNPVLQGPKLIVSPLLATLYPDAMVQLEPGTYILTKKVYVNNESSAVPSSTYLNDHIEELKQQSERWLYDDNCCGPITIDASGFDCDEPEEFECGDTNFETKLTELASALYPLISGEQHACVSGDPLACSSSYIELLNNESSATITPGDFLSDDFKDELTFKNGLLRKLICTEQIPTNLITYCFTVYGALLEQNIQRAELVYAGDTDAGSNPDIGVNTEFDVLESIYNCLGYDPDMTSCARIKNVVFLGSGTANETTAISSAASDPDYFYYLVWNTSNTDFSSHFVAINSQQAILVQGVDFANVTGTTPPNWVQQQLCADANRYPNPLTSGISDEAEARAELAGHTCACLAAITTPSTPPPGYPGIVPSCEDACESKRLAFKLAINNYIEQCNLAKSPSQFSSDDDGWESFSDIFQGEDMECYLDAMVEQCKKQCQLPLTTLITEESSVACDIAAGFMSPFDGVYYTCAAAYISDIADTDPEEYAQLQDSLFKEQMAYTQALQWGAEFAPTAEVVCSSLSACTTNFDMDCSPSVPENFGYSEFGGSDYVKKEIIDFFYSSLNQAMLRRNSVETIASISPLYSLSNNTSHSGNYFVEQHTRDLVLDQGFNREVTAVANVIWDPVDLATLDDDILIEINVALYCTGVSHSKLLYWEYGISPSCQTFAIPSPLVYHVEEDVVRFYFDVAGTFHAVLRDDACTPLNLDVSSNICEENYITEATVTVGACASCDIYQGVLLEVGPQGSNEGESVYLYDDIVFWQGDEVATAAAIANAINTSFTSPNYTATVEPPGTNTIVIKASANTDTDPINFAITVSPEEDNGVQTDLFASIGVTTFFTRCGTPMNLVTCTPPADNFGEVCPYGFIAVGEEGPANAEVIGNLGIATELSAFQSSVSDFWKSELVEIAQFRENALVSNFTQNPDYPVSGLPALTSPNSYSYFQSSKDYLIDGVWYVAYVSALQKNTECISEVASLEEWIRFEVGLHCRSDIDNKLVHFVVGDVKGAGGIIYPELARWPNQTTSPCTASGQNPNLYPPLTDTYIFDAITVPSFLGPPSQFLFEFNDGNVSTTAWTPDFSESTSAVVYSTLQTPPLQVFGVPITDFLTGVYQGCVKACVTCMRWVDPIILNEAPAGAPIEIRSCDSLLAEFIANQVSVLLTQCLEDKTAELEDSYNENCLYNIDDEFSIQYDLTYGHYTLYYYDRANNLIATVPPQGVEILALDPAQRASIKDLRENNTGPGIFPRRDNHAMVTEYFYNSIKQLIYQRTPDGGGTRFWYNATGQLVLSQDSAQAGCGGAADPRYSYTKYDALGRIIEVGELTDFVPQNTNLVDYSPCTVASPHDEFQVIEQLFTNPSFPTGLAAREVVTTTYTTPGYVDYNGQPQENLRNRVSFVATDDGYTTFYSYDPHGNVAWLVQELPEIGRKTIRYEYDLVSGNVLKVFYMEGTTEQFIHQYKYDEDNRILEVLTSKDGLNYDREARYNYYRHGPLSRTEIGEDQLQGIDNIYTIEGYLKSRNQVDLDATGAKDPGMDGAKVATLELAYTGTDLYINDVSFGTAAISTIEVSGDVFTFVTPVVQVPGEPGTVAKKIVEQINALYDYTTNPLKASNGNGLSPVITVYAPDAAIGDAVFIDNNQVGTMTNNGFISDEFAMELGYYDGDYGRLNTFIGSDNTAGDPYALGIMTASANSLYNGNISSWMSNSREGQTGSGINAMGLRMNIYRYDKLNRLKKADFTKFSSSWSSTLGSDADPYDVRLDYDHNGNITYLKRNGYKVSGSGDYPMDDMSYGYKTDAVVNGKLLNNRLYHVNDAVSGSVYGDDIEDQGAFLDYPGNPGSFESGNNYVYDAEGNLIEDKFEKLRVKWNLINKVAGIEKYSDAGLANLVETITFEYDAMGNRVAKTVRNELTGRIEKTTYYVRDASGNTMAIYEKASKLQPDEVPLVPLDKHFITTISLAELPIYGSDRLGSCYPDNELYSKHTYLEEITPAIVPVSALPDALLGTPISVAELDNWVASCIAGGNPQESGIVDLDFALGPPMVNNSATATSPNKSVHKNLSIGEDVNGNLQFKFLIATYPGAPETFNHILDATGQYTIAGGMPALGLGIPDINGNFDTKSIVAQAPDNENIYYVISGANSLMYFHRIDMSVAPNGKYVNGGQMILASGGPLDFDMVENQYALAVYNDLSIEQANKIYVAVHQKSAIRLYEFGFDQFNIGPGVLKEEIKDNQSILQMKNCPGCVVPVLYPKLALGDMQISPDGSELSFSYYASEAHRIRHFDIDPATASLSNASASFIAAEIRPTWQNYTSWALKKHIISMDYSPGGGYLYYLQRAPIVILPPQPISPLAFQFENDLNRIQLSTGNIDLVSNQFGNFALAMVKDDIRRGKDGKLYVNYYAGSCISNALGAPNTHLMVFDNLETTPGVPSTLDLFSGINFAGLPLQPHKKKSVSFFTANSNREVGGKQYELKDHLGNVRTAFGDKRMAFVADLVAEDDITRYDLDVTSWSDYYAFGSAMPGRNYSSSSYRYGFNGREKDDEIKGSGNTYDYSARMYDPRTGRWYSVDGAASRYPSYSPYSFTGLNPIGNIERDGNFWDVIADVVFILYDLAEITYDYLVNDEVDPISVAALSADATAALIPGVTGAGIATRISAKAAQTVVKASNIARKTIKYSGFGGNIAVLADKTTTVLGNFKGSIDKLKEGGVFGEKGLNFLNEAEWSWTKNVNFLDDAISRGDKVRFVSDPTDLNNLYKKGKDGKLTDRLTTFGKEVEYLKGKGYEIKGNEALRKAD